MIKVCATGPVVRGLDVSHYQPKINWSQVKAGGYEFAFLKATEGLTRRDPLYLQHKAGAKIAGLMVGAYHFFRPNIDPIAQAAHFARTIGPQHSPQDLPPVIDFEVSDGAPGADDVSEASIFCQELQRITGRLPIVYTGPYFFQALGASTKGFEKYPLWIAHYGTRCPLVPAPWSKWTFHQYSEKGNIPGVAGDSEDANLFNGTLADLKLLGGQL